MTQFDFAFAVVPAPRNHPCESRGPGEDPLAGALREFEEELGIDPSRLANASITDVLECGDARVPYTMFVLDVPDCLDDAKLSWENVSLYWWHADEVHSLRLHKGFARAWATIRRYSQPVR